MSDGAPVIHHGQLVCIADPPEMAGRYIVVMRREERTEERTKSTMVTVSLIPELPSPADDLRNEGGAPA